MNIVFGNLISDFSNASSMDVKTLNEVLAGAINKNAQVLESKCQFTANGCQTVYRLSLHWEICARLYFHGWFAPFPPPLSCILMLVSFVSGSSGHDSQLPSGLTISVPCSDSRYRSWTSYHQDQLRRRLPVAPIPSRLASQTNSEHSCNSRQ